MSQPYERGEYVTIFDADDIPDPLQLRRAVYAFAHAPETSLLFRANCVTTTPIRTSLTKWFSIEFDPVSIVRTAGPE